MIKSTKIAFLVALVASVSGFSAEEEEISSSGEVSMSKAKESCPRPDDCKGAVMEFDYYKHDPNDAEYDVYTQGKDGECESKVKQGCSGSKCGRKGAAKEAQE